jgi:hypothetical protein
MFYSPSELGYSKKTTFVACGRAVTVMVDGTKHSMFVAPEVTQSFNEVLRLMKMLLPQGGWSKLLLGQNRMLVVDGEGRAITANVESCVTLSLLCAVLRCHLAERPPKRAKKEPK